MAGLIGCTEQEWGAYENGQKRPGWHRIEIICTLLDISPSWLMFGIGPPRLSALAGIPNGIKKIY